MLMLIPMFVIVSLVVILTALSTTDAIESQAAQIMNAGRAVASHHNIVLRNPPAATGFVTVPGSGVITAFEGLATYAHNEGGTIFLMTWPGRFGTTGAEVPPSFHSDEDVRNSVMRGGRVLAENDTLPGYTVEGKLLFEGGPFLYRVGDVMIPFSPPVLEGAPVILTVLSGTRRNPLPSGRGQGAFFFPLIFLRSCFTARNAAQISAFARKRIRLYFRNA